MLLGLATAMLVLAALVGELNRPRLASGVAHARAFVRAFGRVFAGDARHTAGFDYDPGRERRAEQRARELLRSCVSDHEWAMYRDFGFLCVSGGSEARYAYLVYPHKPIVAYVPGTGVLLSEYCVAFPDHTRPYGSARLPDADDVLAKWMALVADERRLIADANMHLPGRQIDPRRVARDLARLERWEREYRVGPAGAVRMSAAAGGVPNGLGQAPAGSGRMLAAPAGAGRVSTAAGGAQSGSGRAPAGSDGAGGPGSRARGFEPTHPLGAGSVRAA